jgi:hypothetical protein
LRDLVRGAGLPFKYHKDKPGYRSAGITDALIGHRAPHVIDHEIQRRIAQGYFDLPRRARTRLYRRPEGARMFWKKRREKISHEQDARQTQERFERNERAGKEIYAHMAELKSVPRENLPDAAFMLFMAAKQQSELIRRSIKERGDYDFDFDTLTDGDLATYLAEDAAYALRNHVTEPQTFLEAMSEQLPDVHFTIQQQDAVSMMAAMIRVQRLEGILEGLRLAGLLNEAPKGRHGSPETGESR